MIQILLTFGSMCIAGLLVYKLRARLKDWMSVTLFAGIFSCVLLMPSLYLAAWWDWQSLDISQRAAIQNELDRGALISSGSLTVKETKETVRLIFPENMPEGAHASTVVLFPFEPNRKIILSVSLFLSIFFALANTFGYSIARKSTTPAGCH